MPSVNNVRRSINKHATWHGTARLKQPAKDKVSEGVRRTEKSELLPKAIYRISSVLSSNRSFAAVVIILFCAGNSVASKCTKNEQEYLELPQLLYQNRTPNIWGKLWSCSGLPLQICINALTSDTAHTHASHRMTNVGISVDAVQHKIWRKKKEENRLEKCRKKRNREQVLVDSNINILYVPIERNSIKIHVKSCS